MRGAQFICGTPSLAACLPSPCCRSILAFRRSAAALVISATGARARPSPALADAVLPSRCLLGRRPLWALPCGIECHVVRVGDVLLAFSLDCLASQDCLLLLALACCCFPREAAR